MWKKLQHSFLFLIFICLGSAQSRIYSGLYIYAFRKAPAQWLLDQNLRAVSISDIVKIFPEQTSRQLLDISVIQGTPIVLRDQDLAKIVTIFDDMRENRQKFLELSRKVP